MRRALITCVLAATFALGVAGVAEATTATISPLSQTHTHGQASNLTLSWTGVKPFRTVCFYYDKNDLNAGYWCYFSTSYDGVLTSNTFWPCTTTTFTQLLNVTDWNSNFKSTTSTSRENGGVPC